jgi:asparagine synthase (glutamine-hydrolysing)
MCGIAAAIGFNDAKEVATRIVSGLGHRGDFSDPVTPIGKNCALATRRLRILDWKRAGQPQVSFDGKVAVTMNGEIYNYVELRERMSKKGVRFKTDCDTEVVANALALWGASAVQEFNGMFSFVALSETGQYWAARDHFGIKPLYFMKVRGGVAFSSEIKPLLSAFPDKKACVEELSPATILHNGRPSLFKPRTSVPAASRNLTANTKQLDRLLHEAVERRLPRDLRCAILFGGGIDSTLILHYAHRLNNNVVPYFIGSALGSDYDHACRFANDRGMNLKKVPVSSQRALRVLEKIVCAVETFEPNVIRNAVFSYFLAEAVHKDRIRVTLCGEGADELFCGYPEMGATLAKTRSEAAVRATRRRFLSDLHRTQLLRVDRCSMQHQVETREPFLDRDVVAFSNNLPLKQLVSGPGASENKLILRNIYSLHPNLPAEIARRKKVVFVEGVGMGDNSPSGPFFDHACQEITDSEFRDLRRRFRRFGLKTKEEALYLDYLSRWLDVGRVPFLKNRPAANSSAFSP